MPEPVTLLVPADARFQAVGPELAGKYCSAAGGSEADAASVSEAVRTAVSALAEGAGDEAQVDIVFSSPDGQVEVTLRCRDRSTVVAQRISTNASR